MFTRSRSACVRAPRDLKTAGVGTPDGLRYVNVRITETKYGPEGVPALVVNFFATCMDEPGAMSTGVTGSVGSNLGALVKLALTSRELIQSPPTLNSRATRAECMGSEK